ncbi:V-type ATP synthase subunit F [Ruminococcaceae bacterium OttesenSCG-928-L11]|nr:V-type ATP synthase subunit F [Ruminococcaceae bacterium OttesenSCG-928-L11]
MKFHLISDNTDTYIGMRMAGIEGVVVHEAEDVSKAVREACADEEIGVVLISAKLMEMCRAEIYEIKLNASRPLIVEVADRHGDGKVSDSITRYVREAVGIKI